ncbi:MAG TPA: CDP-archaeol synthase [Candidatus Limnocylindrales bacterium]|nr:CDP-archaeol synthase [Candidatus Limnocylindrales bacterium]
MIKELIFIWWFFSPAGVSNIAAFVSGKASFLKKYSFPVDFGIKFRGKRLLGDNKTIRGFIFGIIGAIAIVSLQIFLYKNSSYLQKTIPIDYNTINPIIFGFLSGFGAMLGDSIKSFFKRQLNVPPGKSWFPFDQIDYIIGGIIFTSFYIKLSFYEYVLLFFMWFLLHPITTFIGYILRLKNSPL